MLSKKDSRSVPQSRNERKPGSMWTECSKIAMNSIFIVNPNKRMHVGTLYKHIFMWWVEAIVSSNNFRNTRSWCPYYATRLDDLWEVGKI